MDFVAFNLILDDIVFPDGRTAMGALGGGGPQAAFGMKLWADEVGLVAGVGDDLPSSIHDWLVESGINQAGLRRSDLPTLRAWQVTEADGRRTQVWRVTNDVMARQLRRSVEDLPREYRGAKGFHFGIHPDEPDLEFTRGLRALGGVVSVELFKPCERRPEAETLRALVTAPHILSLNQGEARSLVGDGEPRSLARRLVEAGAWIVALRLDAAGSLVIEGTLGRGARIPAAPVEVIDPIGAGNAYSGGFLAGWVETHDVALAGLYGAVAASFVVQQVGVPVADERLRAEARRRLEALRPHVERVSL